MTEDEAAMGKHEALIARVRAALRLLDNEDITPAGRRVLDKILDAAEDDSLDGQIFPYDP